MKEEMKKSIYSVLNLIDFLETVDFLTVDFDKVNQLRQVLFTSINEGKDPSAAIKTQANNRYELISILPAFFASKKLFKTKKEITNFAVQKMGITAAAKWGNKTINDITGNIIMEIIKGEDELYQKGISVINQYIVEKPNFNKKNTAKTKNGNFMNMWFDFFEKYRKEKDDI
jgi:hypothetical protein